MSRVFATRHEAGRDLGRVLLETSRGDADFVLGLPRGGVPVAFEVASALQVPLDVFLVRKLGTPGHEELAMGAIASGDVRIVNANVVEALGIDERAIEAVADRELVELGRRERLYRDGRPMPVVAGRAVVLVDDGLATGATMEAAVTALRRLAARAILVAVPVGSADACAAFERIADGVVCVTTPEPFGAVGMWYEDFSPTEDDEVCTLLGKAGLRG